MTSTFECDDRTFELFDHPYNRTVENERGVEIPLARDFLGRVDLDVQGVGLEVGNVLSHYQPTMHRIVDRYERSDGVVACDVFDVTGEFDWIIAISTLEHVRHDEPLTCPTGGLAALVYLMGLVKPGGGMFVSIPLATNDMWDRAIVYGTLPCFQGGWRRRRFFLRVGDRQWKEAEPQFVARRQPSDAANDDESQWWPSAVWIGEWWR